MDKIKIVLSNAKDYIIENSNVGEFIKKIADSNYKINKDFICIQDGVYINPNHIIEILVLEKEQKQEINTEGLLRSDSAEISKLIKNIKVEGFRDITSNFVIKVPDLNIK